MASKIKVDQIEGSAGSSITIPSGQTLTITDGLAASTIGSGTLADARIPNLNASKITAGTIATARLGSGTASSSTFLRGDSTFATVGGGGKILQVIEDISDGEFETSSSSFVATNLSVNITPSATTSKVLVMAAINGDTKGNRYIHATLHRDSTELSAGNEGMQMLYGLDGERYYGGLPLLKLDSPNTTSQVTYTVQVRTNTGTMRIGQNNMRNSIVVMEVGA
nr:hypothetical protein [uncultured Mediterranean phage uvMED]